MNEEKKKVRARADRNDPGSVIQSRDGRRTYVVDDDGSWRRMAPAAVPRTIQVLRMVLGVPKALYRYLTAPPAERGLYERILRSKNAQAAAELLLEGSNRYRDASSGTRRKWRRAVAAVDLRDRLGSLRRRTA